MVHLYEVQIFKVKNTGLFICPSLGETPPLCEMQCLSSAVYGTILVEGRRHDQFRGLELDFTNMKSSCFMSRLDGVEMLSI